MKVLNLSHNDYACFSLNNAKALRSVGVDCKCMTETAHVFHYSEYPEIAPLSKMIQAAHDVDIIQIFHSSVSILQAVKRLNKRIMVYHTGTNYRARHMKMNGIFNPVVERTFIDSPEFYNLGAKNITYIATAIDTDKIQAVHAGNSSPIFAHYPSLPDTKGTVKIIEMMAKNPDAQFIYSTQKLSHEDNLKRMSHCDVYIELFAPKQGDNTYGSFGVTAFEAAAMGKTVITNSLFHNVYQESYGTSGWLLIANTEEQFIEYVRRIVEHGIDIARERYTRSWIESFHSYKATGEYLLKFLDRKPDN